MKQKKNRNELVLKLALENKTFWQIGEKLNITVQRVGQILNLMGYTKERIREEIYIPIAKGLNEKLHGQNVCYYKIMQEINERKLNVKVLKRYGFVCHKHELLKKRNKKIAEMYKNGKTAKEICETQVCGLNSITSVYYSIKKENVRKFPKVKRGIKGIYENEKTLKLIYDLRENKKLSFGKISEHLNKAKVLTMGNKIFTPENTLIKYKKYKSYIEKLV